MKRLQTALLATMLIFLVFSCSKTLSEKEYYDAAKEAYTKEKFELAIDNFKKLIEHYPQGVKTAEASFMLGYIYANDLKKFDKAKVYYEQFIKNYPDHSLADDAQYELQTLGKDINELPIFQKINADSVQK